MLDPPTFVIHGVKMEQTTRQGLQLHGLKDKQFDKNIAEYEEVRRRIGRVIL